MSKLQVLVATIHQTDLSKVEEMNICSDVIFANQAIETSYDENEYDFGKAKMVTTNTKGVGINRNLALLYADGDYLLFSDDDLRYIDGYKEAVLKAFEELPKADGIIFNIATVGGDVERRVNSRIKRVRWYNSMNYGAVRLAVRAVSVSRENIMFNTNFGGGTSFSCGEDTLFIWDMIKKGLKLYTYPLTIATVNQAESTWFRGYNEKYYYDKGVLFSAISRKFALLLCLQDLIRHRNYKKQGYSFFTAYGFMKNGVKGYKDLRPYKD